MVDSISKTRLSAERIDAIIARSLGPGTKVLSVSECEEGWFNAVYRLTLEDRVDVVLKVAPPPDVRVLRYEADIMSAEVGAIRLIGERTNVPVPRVLAWDDSCELIPSPYFVMTKCSGVLLSSRRSELSAPEARTVDEQIVRHVAAINAITADTFGRFTTSAPKSPSWTDSFGGLISDLLADAADANAALPVTAGEIERIVASGADALESVGPPRLVHWDLWDPNVFIDPETLQVVGVVDFERVLWADPLMEAQFRGKREPDFLTEAYGPLFADPSAVTRRRLYDLYLYLVMLVECSYRHYPTPDIENLARALLPLVLDEIRLADT